MGRKIAEFPYRGKSKLGCPGLYVLFLDSAYWTQHLISMYLFSREVSKYEKIMRQDYAKFSYGTNVSTAISNEVKGCRENVALFDLSSFGKVILNKRPGVVQD